MLQESLYFRLHPIEEDKLQSTELKLHPNQREKEPKMKKERTLKEITPLRDLTLSG